MAWNTPGAGAMLLILLYTTSYFGDPGLPGANPSEPLGWWGWFDQGQYLRSARAFARLDLSADAHWYPPGYALMGAPFVRWSPAHPFVLVNVACLLACFAGYLSFARRAGVESRAAAPLFVACVGLTPGMMRQWTVPWNTSPAAALTWLLLAAVAAHREGTRRPGLSAFAVGALAAAIPLCRPSDAVVAGLCVLAGGTTRTWRRDIGWIGLGAAGPLLSYAVLHGLIYGPAPSAYMIVSGEIGFSLHAWGWKAVTLLLDPAPWYAEGGGLLQRAPYLALVPAGMAFAAFRPSREAGPLRLLAAAVAVHVVLYVSYVDLVPSGMWRFLNVHYFKWAIPAGGLLAWVALREAWRETPGRVAILGSILLTGVTLVPVPVAPDAPARMLVFSGPRPRFEDVYFAPLDLQDRLGPMRNIADMRVIPAPEGLRLLAIRRDFAGGERLEGWPAPLRYAAAIRFGWPGWLRHRSH